MLADVRVRGASGGLYGPVLDLGDSYTGVLLYQNSLFVYLSSVCTSTTISLNKQASKRTNTSSGKEVSAPDY